MELLNKAYDDFNLLGLVLNLLEKKSVIVSSRLFGRSNHRIFDYFVDDVQH